MCMYKLILYENIYKFIYYKYCIFLYLSKKNCNTKFFSGIVDLLKFGIFLLNNIINKNYI